MSEQIHTSRNPDPDLVFLKGNNYIDSKTGEPLNITFDANGSKVILPEPIGTTEGYFVSRDKLEFIIDSGSKRKVSSFHQKK